MKSKDTVFFLIKQDGFLFAKHAVSFLKELYQRMPLEKRLWGNNLINNEDEIRNIIQRFKTVPKKPYLNDVLDDLKAAMNLTDLLCCHLIPFQ